MSGSLERMIIYAYSDPGFQTLVAQPFNPLTVWINPASYTEDSTIIYNDRQAQGSNGPSPEFNRFGADKISFDLIFDATGVIPMPIPGVPIPANGVTGIIAQFRLLAATMNGKTHRANYLKLSWGQLQFQCVLCKLNINYTLFRPDGTPLRAKLSVTFLGFTSEVRLAELANTNSPDLTHIITVTAGDTLPALCHDIYGDSGFYLQVAAFNGLTGFRTLLPGAQLVFPPLSGSAS
jgi:hypothetical protein